MKTLKSKQPLIKRYGQVLLGLRNTPDTFKRNIIKRCDNCLIHCICECCHNVLKGSVNMNKSHKASLKHWSKDIRFLADKTISTKRKRKIITPQLINVLIDSVKSKIENTI